LGNPNRLNHLRWKGSQLKHILSIAKIEERGRFINHIIENFGMTYLKYRSSRGIGLGLLAFLGTSQEGGDEPRERKRGRITSKHSKAKTKCNFIKAKRW
jgi:hypothetical protein